MFISLASAIAVNISFSSCPPCYLREYFILFLSSFYVRFFSSLLYPWIFHSLLFLLDISVNISFSSCLLSTFISLVPYYIREYFILFLSSFYVHFFSSLLYPWIFHSLLFLPDISVNISFSSCLLSIFISLSPCYIREYFILFLSSFYVHFFSSLLYPWIFHSLLVLPDISVNISFSSCLLSMFISLAPCYIREYFILFLSSLLSPWIFHSLLVLFLYSFL
jgi:hypothetical protein